MSELEQLAADCELYAKVIDGIKVVADDWQPGDPERKEPRETLLKAAAALRLAAQQDGATIGEFGGMRIVADKATPNDVIEFHHPDGRIDRFRRVEQTGD